MLAERRRSSRSSAATGTHHVEGRAAPTRLAPNEQQGGTWDVFFWVRDVRALHAELAASGADVVYGPLVQTAYNMEEFAVRDSNGYVLGFGQSLGRYCPPRDTWRKCRSAAPRWQGATSENILHI